MIDLSSVKDLSGKGKKWLITGGCGFIGTNLIRRLVTEGSHSIRVIDNLSVGSREDLASISKVLESDQPGKFSSGGIEFIAGDILDEKLAQEAACGADIIVHLAANTGVGPSVENPRLDCVTNVIGTLNYLEAARINGVDKFIFASSGAPVGECEPPIHEEKVPHPVSPYGASKLSGEGYCSSYFRTFAINTVALRFGNVYGPGSAHKSSVVAKFIRRALNGETLEIFGDGAQTRDFIYIDDLTEAVLLAATTQSIGGEIFQIASNKETTVGEMTMHLVKSLEQEGVERIKVINTELRLGDVNRNYSNTTKAKHYLGWAPKVSLDEGLSKTIEYFLKKEQV